MAFISLPGALMGIVGLLAYSPDTAKPLAQLAEILLRQESTLTRGERELIAAYVSYRNNCTFCTNSHTAASAHHYNDDINFVLNTIKDPEHASISPKLKALLNIAGKVQILGKAVKQEDIDRAKQAGATDKEIHDTVLIAAAFCMYNRYVDGLGTSASNDINDYIEMGKLMADIGYVNINRKNIKYLRN